MRSYNMRHLLVPALVACSVLLWSGTAHAQSGRAGTATGTTGGTGTVRGVVTTPGSVPRGGIRVPTTRRPVPPQAGTGIGQRGLSDRFAYRYGTLRQTPLGIVVGTGTVPLRSHLRGYHPYPGATIIVQPSHRVYSSYSQGIWVAGAPVWGGGEQPRPWRPETVRERCAVVVVLDRSSRGWWQEIALPLAGAENVDELQRVLNARLAEGTAFRIQDAAGTWLEIPAANGVERIVVEPCDG
jgi:hypothetical protein